MGKIVFESHLPGFVSEIPLAIPKQEFDSLEDLLKHPWITGWKDHFISSQWCYSSNIYENTGSWKKSHLMVFGVNKKNKVSWWVLGYMNVIPSSLPSFQELLKQESEKDTVKQRGQNEIKKSN